MRRPRRSSSRRRSSPFPPTAPRRCGSGRAARQADGQWAIEARNNGAGWVRVEQALAETATGLRLADGFSFGTVLPGGARRWVVGADPRIGDRARFQQINRTADHGATSPPPHNR